MAVNRKSYTSKGVFDMAERKKCNSFYANIYIAGDPSDAQRICRQFCNDVGLCVTVTPTTYIYTGGAEAGVIVGCINYPRFPDDNDAILGKAFDLAHRLMSGLFQHSFSIETPDKTHWVSVRPE